MDYRIYPPDGFVEATVRLPLSKSISNRALIINALTPGAAPLGNVARCDDTDAMTAALCAADGRIDIGAAGTAMRFLTAYFAATPGREVTLDGSERMRQRPIGQLVDALREAGADISYTDREGFPPLAIKGKRLKGGDVRIDGAISSQYISALLMVAPTMTNGLSLKIGGELPSTPYIKMTLKMMEQRGVEAVVGPDSIDIAPGRYSLPADSSVEEDWSAASYWYEITALSAGNVTLPGLTLPSLQGDARCVEIFERLGVLTERDDEGALTLTPSPEMHSRLEIDLSEQPDLAQTVAVTAAMLGVPFRLSGLASLKIKETDRLEALRKELDKLGIAVETERDEALVWDGRRRPVFEMPRIDTYQDHRMAMAFAPVAVFCPEIIINDIEVVSKSYPGYWDDLRAAGFTLQNATEAPLEPEPDEEEE